MNKRTRFGILSFAHFHANWWAQAINEIPEARFVGIWDDNAQRGRDAAERYGTRYWEDLSSLLKECDSVGITSETVNHACLVEEAAAAGVHILCEKPMATTEEDCNRIARAVHTGGVIYMQNLPKRLDPINRELVELAHNGSLGPITLVRIRHGHFHGLEKTFQNQWFVNPALNGGGTLIDEGVHAADFLLWLLGEPEHVYATVSNHTLGLPVEDTALSVFTFPSGTIAEVANSWAFVAAEQSVEVLGSRGSAVLSGVDLASRDFAHPPYLKVFRQGDLRGTWQGSPTVPFFKASTFEFHRQGPMYFIRCIREGLPPPVGVEDGRKSVQMILAAYRSARSGQTQPIHFTGKKP